MPRVMLHDFGLREISCLTLPVPAAYNCSRQGAFTTLVQKPLNPKPHTENDAKLRMSDIPLGPKPEILTKAPQGAKLRGSFLTI